MNVREELQRLQDLTEEARLQEIPGAAPAPPLDEDIIEVLQEYVDESEEDADDVYGSTFIWYVYDVMLYAKVRNQMKSAPDFGAKPEDAPADIELNTELPYGE